MKQKKREMRILLILLLDCLAITLAGGAALLVRFDFSFDAVPRDFSDIWWRFLPLQLAITIAVFFARRMYHYVWHSVGVHDVMDMILSVLLSFTAVSTVRGLAHARLPISVIFISLMLEMIALVGMRCGIRFLVAFRQAIKHTAGKERILLIGAGEAGKMLLQEMNNGRHTDGKVCCIIDDNPIKKGKYLDGVRIVGGREHIRQAVKREGITQILFAIPTATSEQKKEILDICQSTGVRIRVLPGIYQLMNGTVSLAAVKDIQVEDLLGRAPVQLDTDKITDFLQDKVVMITGGGGSIGSELCRQIMRHRPRKLIILDIYENNAYDIQQELRRSPIKDVELCVEIASVRDKVRIDEVFAQHR
ncbi:MAG: polysaccharide biosynthesis protein, partial [Clostridia bacterium]|nr:polysaccharide biosynthesis protein [Clostridia bacterium]